MDECLTEKRKRLFREYFDLETEAEELIESGVHSVVANDFYGPKIAGLILEIRELDLAYPHVAASMPDLRIGDYFDAA